MLYIIVLQVYSWCLNGFCASLMTLSWGSVLRVRRFSWFFDEVLMESVCASS